MVTPFLDPPSLGRMQCVQKSGYNNRPAQQQLHAAIWGDVDELVQTVESETRRNNNGRGGFRHPAVPAIAAERNSLDMLMYATENGFPKTSNKVAEWAAKYQNLEMLKYATRNGYPKTNPNVTKRAVERPPVVGIGSSQDSMEMLRYVTKHGYPKHELVTFIAAARGDMNMLDFATRHGYPKHKDVPLHAALWEDLDVLKYATAHDYPKTDERIAAFAAEHENLDMLVHVIDNGYPYRKASEESPDFVAVALATIKARQDLDRRVRRRICGDGGGWRNRTAGRMAGNQVKIAPLTPKSTNRWYQFVDAVQTLPIHDQWHKHMLFSDLFLVFLFDKLSTTRFLP